MDNYQPFAAGNSGNESAPSDAGTVANFLSLGGPAGSSGSGDGGDGGGFNPDIHLSPDKRNADGSFRKKRGRKPGNTSTNSRSGRKADYSTNLESLTTVLAIVHAGLASATKTPELALDDDDAGALAKAAANVLIEFDIQPNPKVQAVVGLVMTAGAVYGPKVYMIRERKREAKESKD